ncbi:MAG: hypothetical protein IJ037_07830 [Clostridia bacterium]|nr:hypothetical protein [Clostridia bacterium]
MKSFDITYFHGPFAQYIVKPEVIADIAASGMTLVPISGDLTLNRTVLKLLGQYGLRGEVHDSRIAGLYYADNIAAVDDTVRQIFEDYAEFDNVAGWDITDEPNAAKFPILAAIVNAFRRYSPDRETVINLFPNYASPEQLGNPDYVTHLEEFVNVVRPHFISYDHYHFLGRENRRAVMESDVSERERLIRLSAETTVNRGGFFDNIEDIRRVSLKYGLDAMLIVLLTEHGPYRNLTYGELLWEVNMSLAYGMKRISYFTYWEPSHDDHWQWTNAMCDTEGNRMQHWYDVQSINAAVKPAGEFLFNRTSMGVYHIGDAPEKNTSLFTSFGKIQKIDGERGVIGIFDDGSMYLVNRDFLAPRTFRIHADAPLTVMRNGIFTDLADCDITLAAGEAVLLK